MSAESNQRPVRDGPATDEPVEANSADVVAQRQSVEPGQASHVTDEPDRDEPGPEFTVTDEASESDALEQQRELPDFDDERR